MSLRRLLQSRRVRVCSRWLLAPALAVGCSGRSSTTIVYQIAAGGAGANSSTVSSSTPNSGGQSPAGGGSTGGNPAALITGGGVATNSGGAPTGGVFPVAAGGAGAPASMGGAGSSASGGTANTGSGGTPSATGGGAGSSGGPYVCLEQPRDPLAAPCTPSEGEQLWRGHCYRTNISWGDTVIPPGNPPPPQSLTFFTLENDNKHYADEWTYSENSCRAWGGHLATINCDEELTFLRQFAEKIQTYVGFWVGGFRTADGQWHWADGSTWGFEPENWGYRLDSGIPTDWQRLMLLDNNLPGSRWTVAPFSDTDLHICERIAR